VNPKDLEKSVNVHDVIIGSYIIIQVEFNIYLSA